MEVVKIDEKNPSLFGCCGGLFFSRVNSLQLKTLKMFVFRGKITHLSFIVGGRGRGGGGGEEEGPAGLFPRLTYHSVEHERVRQRGILERSHLAALSLFLVSLISHTYRRFHCIPTEPLESQLNSLRSLF